MIKSTDRYLAAAVGAAFALLVLYLALPRAVSEYFVLTGNGASPDRSRSADEKSLRAYAVSRAHALEWADDPDHARELARAYLRLTRFVPRENRAATIAATAAASVRELKARPLSHSAWWRLALTEDMSARKRTPGAVPYLLRSVETRTNALSLMPARTDLILSHWWQLPAATRKRLHPQILATFRRHRGRVLQMADDPWKLAIVRAVLSETPEELGAFEGALYKSRKR